MSQMNSKPSERDWEGKHFAFFSNTACEYYPCHRVEDGGELNCLFCYCPLYILGRDCGGDFTYLDNGIKDCSRCLLPHRRECYGSVTERFQEISAALAALERPPDRFQLQSGRGDAIIQGTGTSRPAGG